jgi:hypothetical protein
MNGCNFFPMCQQLTEMLYIHRLGLGLGHESLGYNDPISNPVVRVIRLKLDFGSYSLWNWLKCHPAPGDDWARPLQYLVCQVKNPHHLLRDQRTEFCQPYWKLLRYPHIVWMHVSMTGSHQCYLQRGRGDAVSLALL